MIVFLLIVFNVINLCVWLLLIVFEFVIIGFVLMLIFLKIWLYVWYIFWYVWFNDVLLVWNEYVFFIINLWLWSKLKCGFFLLWNLDWIWNNVIGNCLYDFNLFFIIDVINFLCVGFNVNCFLCLFCKCINFGLYVF